MNKISLQGLRDLATDEYIKPQIDYGIFLVATRISEEKMDDDEGIKFRMKFSHIDQIIDLRENKDIKFAKGKSDSQQYRFLIINKLGEDEYHNYMGWLKSNIEKHTEEYIEQLDKIL